MGRDFSWFVLIILRIGTAANPKREPEQLAARRSKNVLWLRAKCPAPVCSDWAKEPLTTYINPNCPKDVAVPGDQAGKLDQCVAQLRVCYLSVVLCFLLSLFLPSFEAILITLLSGFHVGAGRPPDFLPSPEDGLAGFCIPGS